ncbi:MAG: hypothetical protein Q8Q09_07530 [Deltaproteobacteria bacterium]|nr:hypothetical protein [Deltaproteobacteria bacterium]
MSSHLPPVQFVTRAALVLGAALAVGACEDPAPQPSPSTPSATPQATPTPAPSAVNQLPTQLSPTQNPLANGQQPSLLPQPVMVQQPQQAMLQPSLAGGYGAPPPRQVPPPPAAPQTLQTPPPPAPVGPNDPGSHARRYGAPAYAPWDHDHV